MASYLYFSVLFIAVVHISEIVSITFPNPPPPPPTPKCKPTSDKFCRVVYDCANSPADSSCFAFPQQVSCVPQGVDNKCKRVGMKTVLVGALDKPRDLKPMRCRKRKPCRGGDYKCVRGYCCYKPSPQPKPDAVCSPCPSPCPSSYSCQKVKAACGNTYACLPVTKPGKCPVAVVSPKINCALVRVGQFCKNDGDCTEDLKCCSTICGGTSCVKPQPVITKPPMPGPGGQCPPVKPDPNIDCSMIAVEDMCARPGGCGPGLMCCDSTCGGRACVEPQPAVVKPPTDPIIGDQCPPVRADPSLDCSMIAVEDMCADNNGCGPGLMCCDSTCGGRACVRPITILN